MRILLVIALIFSAPSFATNWVVTDGELRLAYDKDTIVREGSFASVYVGKNGDTLFRARFDCKALRIAGVSVAGYSGEWAQIPRDRRDLLEMRSAVCNNWWEFWKR